MAIDLIYLFISLAIIAYNSVRSVIGIVLAIAISFLCGKLGRKNPLLCYGGILCTIIILLLLRIGYDGPFSIFNILGISYFGLQIIAYLMDIKNDRLNSSMTFIEYCLYICYYPHLIVGPIDKPMQFTAELRKKELNVTKAFDGALRILWGLFKKLVIANKVAAIITLVTNQKESCIGLISLMVMVLYSLELYCDFSGAIDMVLGLTNCLGFKLSENFNHPFRSQTVGEFWRRWHITLGGFLRDYVYIPLGGNRKGKIRKIINILIVFIISGVWHGKGYLLWGLINGILVCLGDLLKTKNKYLNITLTFITISLLWAFFIWPDNGYALRMIASIFTDFSSGLKTISLLDINLIECLVLVVSTICLLMCEMRKEVIKKFLSEHKTLQTVCICLLAITVLLFGDYGIGFVAEAFIYNRF